MRAWLCVVLAAAACGGGSGIGDDDQQPDGNTGSDSGTEPGWTTLIERNWQLSPIEEGFKCVRLQVQTDTYINGFHVKSPPGTHHELLTISSTSSTPIGPYNCDALNTDNQMLFAGGIASNDLLFPAGVAIKLPAGTYINLNLHVANFTDAPISGVSGIEIKTLPASQVVHEAEAIFAGTWSIHIPPTSVDQVAMGSCVIPQTWTLLDLWPHMHGYAKHQLVTVRRVNGNTDTLLDEPYSYMEQKNYPMTNAVLNPNDELKVVCTYDNPTSNELVYGDSAIAEMCFTGFYKYPATGLDKYFCAPM